jgi:translation initiation factor 2 beta subunit (eIF-2beta)/eIF-5
MKKVITTTTTTPTTISTTTTTAMGCAALASDVTAAVESMEIDEDEAEWEDVPTTGKQSARVIAAPQQLSADDPVHFKGEKKKTKKSTKKGGDALAVAASEKKKVKKRDSLENVAAAVPASEAKASPPLPDDEELVLSAEALQLRASYSYDSLYADFKTSLKREYPQLYAKNIAPYVDEEGLGDCEGDEGHHNVFAAPSSISSGGGVSLSAPARASNGLPIANVAKTGSKLCTFVNFPEICKFLRRSEESLVDHVRDFILAELATTASTDQAGGLVLRGKFDSVRVGKVLHNYVLKYVLCPSCKGLQTSLARDSQLRQHKIVCGVCRQETIVEDISAGYRAVKKGDRKAARSVTNQ